MTDSMSTTREATREPRTEAGTRLFTDWKHDPKELWTVAQVAEAIVAIEADARSAALAEVGLAVAAIPEDRRLMPGLVRRSQVAAAIAHLRQGEPT